MAFEFYGDASKAAELTGNSEINSTDLTTAPQVQINNFINTSFRPEGFGKGSADELYTIKDSKTNTLVLRNMPIIKDSITLYDDMNSGDPIEVNSDCYVVDNDSGIIQILTDKQLSGENLISYFAKGIKSIRVTYEYGFDVVPDDIIAFANLLGAKWLDINNSQSNMDGLKSYKAADYTETYDILFSGVKSKYDSDINTMFKNLKSIYNRGV